MRRRWLSIAMLLAGCSIADVAPPAAPPKQMPTKQVPPMPTTRPRYAPPPDRFVQSVLLTFDSPSDAAFVDARGVTIDADPDRPANRVLRARGATTLKLGALVSGRAFPGDWDLVGLRVRGETAFAGTLALLTTGSPGADRLADASIDAPAGTWRSIWIDLGALRASATSRAAGRAAQDGLVLTLAVPAGATALIDDLMLAQTRTTVADSIVPKSGERFVVRRVGAEWQAAFGDEVVLRVPSLPFVAGGYRVVDACPTRVLFATADESHSLCIDRTGRLIADARARLDAPLLRHASAIAETASPAEIAVVGDDGRVERSLAGDRDNDGFDETRGCYSVRAGGGGRVAFRLARRGATVRWPVVEVYDLPPGAPSVWLDGQLVPWTTRLADGRVRVELPIELERPVEVQVRIR